MKRIFTYYLFCCLLPLLGVITSCNTSNGKKKMPPMTPLYMYRDKEPMGTNIAYRLLPHQFTGAISLVSKKIKGDADILAYQKGTCYIAVWKKLLVNNEELEQLLNYVGRGNEFFISASGIDYRLLDTLDVKYTYEYINEAVSDGVVHKRNTSLLLADTVNYGKKQYGFFYYPFAGMFTGYDSSTTTVLGINDNRQPDYIVVKYGKGKFYFHTEPTAFTNYFLLTGGNTQYYSQVFSYLNKDAHEVFWGDVYRFGKKSDDFSALSIFWNNPLLKYALLLACTLMLLYIAFGSKRKRRLIPALPGNENASLSFVQTIGNLYLQKKDNRNIAIKKITYFLEYVRNNYHISTNNINMEFVQSLSRKSGIAESSVQLLMEKADYINNAETVTDQELFEVNNLVDEFYKR